MPTYIESAALRRAVKELAGDAAKNKAERLKTLKRRLRELTTNYNQMGYTFSETERNMRVRQIRDKINELEKAK